MSNCECLPQCPFFNHVMQDMPTTTDRMMKKYCLRDSANCARYMVFEALGSQKIPPTLFPNQTDRALELISLG